MQKNGQRFYDHFPIRGQRIDFLFLFLPSFRDIHEHLNDFVVRKIDVSIQ